MKGNRVLMTLAITATLIASAPAAALAHGENDARVIVRDAQVGPYTVSLWNVLGDASSDLPAHIIVMAKGADLTDESVVVVADGRSLAATPSTTIDGAWETSTGVDPGASISVLIDRGDIEWASGSFEVPHPFEPNLVSRLIGSFAVFVTTAAAYWLLRRTAHVWRRPTAAVAGT